MLKFDRKSRRLPTSLCLPENLIKLSTDRFKVPKYLATATDRHHLKFKRKQLIIVKTFERQLQILFLSSLFSFFFLFISHLYFLFFSVKFSLVEKYVPRVKTIIQSFRFATERQGDFTWTSEILFASEIIIGLLGVCRSTNKM